MNKLSFPVNSVFTCWTQATLSRSTAASTSLPQSLANEFVYSSAVDSLRLAVNPVIWSRADWRQANYRRPCRNVPGAQEAQSAAVEDLQSCSNGTLPKRFPKWHVLGSFMGRCVKFSAKQTFFKTIFCLSRNELIVVVVRRWTHWFTPRIPR